MRIVQDGEQKWTPESLKARFGGTNVLTSTIPYAALFGEPATATTLGDFMDSEAKAYTLPKGDYDAVLPPYVFSDQTPLEMAQDFPTVKSQRIACTFRYSI